MATAIERPFARSVVVGREAKTPLARLTRRQLDVARCRCVRRLSVPATAAALGISKHTVKNHMTGLLRAFGEASMYGVCFELGRECGRKEGQG